MTRPRKTGSGTNRQDVTMTDITDPAIRAEVLDFFDRAFRNSRPPLEDCLTRGVWKGAFFRPEWTRVAVADGHAVSGVVCAPRQVRFGSVLVPATTVGPVGTHRHHRRKGYAAAAMHDALRAMTERGVILSYLQGLPDFYYRFGYFPYRGQYHVRFQRDDARKEAARGRLRTFRKTDIPAVANIYRRVSAGRTMSARRDRKLWNWLLRYAVQAWFFPTPKVLEDSKGHIIGYLTLRKGDGMSVREIVVKPDEASCRSALGALVREAKRREVRQIELPLPPDDAFAVFVRQYVRAEFVTWTHPTGNQLLAILDFPTLMKRLEPELEARWRRARTRIGNVRFTLASEIGAVGIAVTRGRVRVGEPVRGSRVVVPRRWLSGLLTGYYAVGDIAPRKGARIPARLRPALDVLFPTSCPFIYQGDNY